MTDHNSRYLMDNELFSTVFSGIHDEGIKTKSPIPLFRHPTHCDCLPLLPSEKVLCFSPRFSCET